MPEDTTQVGQEQSLTVLVVEDELLIAMDLEMTLEKHGHTVLGPATSIKSALSLLEHTRPDVALLDINLRGQVIVPVAERLRDMKVPFVLSSAYRSFDFIGSDVLSNAENIGKPADERLIIKALRRAIKL